MELHQGEFHRTCQSTSLQRLPRMMEWIRLINPNRLGENKTTSLDVEADRSPFEADYGRILFSNPFRRLHHKTQVFPMPENDHVHSRLTHSLEVANVGQTLGKMVGKRVIEKHKLNRHLSPEHFSQIVSSACLAHDIGNPPFGHHGERAISQYFQAWFQSPENREDAQKVCEADRLDLCHFEGNAQGFRIITRLNMIKNQGGLRLTYGSLGAFCKYPQSSSHMGEPRPGGKKFGSYNSELDNFKAMATALGLTPVEGKTEAWHRHPLAYLMEASDDICYQILDLEDGVALGLLDKSEFSHLMEPILKTDCSQWDVSRIRAAVISQWIKEVFEVFMAEESAILEGKGRAPLMDLIPSRDSLEQIHRAAISYCYQAPVVVKREVAASGVITQLLDHLVKSATGKHHPGLLKTVLGEDFSKDADLSTTLRSISDSVSSMTDRYALKLYRQLSGLDLSMA